MDLRKFLATNFNSLNVKKHLITIANQFFKDCNNVEILDGGSTIECTNDNGFGVGMTINDIMESSSMEVEFFGETHTLQGERRIKSEVTFYDIKAKQINDIIIIDNTLGSKRTFSQQDITFEMNEENLSCGILEFEETVLPSLNRESFLSFVLQYEIDTNNFTEVSILANKYIEMQNIIDKNINIQNDSMKTIYWPGYKCSIILDTKEKEIEQYTNYPMKASLKLLFNNDYDEKGLIINNENEILSYWE